VALALATLLEELELKITVTSIFPSGVRQGFAEQLICTVGGRSILFSMNEFAANASVTA